MFITETKIIESGFVGILTSLKDNRVKRISVQYRVIHAKLLHAEEAF